VDPGRHIVTQTVRAGARESDPPQWPTSTPEERIDAVWELTLQRMAWQGNQPFEPRLQRSVVHIQRAQR